MVFYHKTLVRLPNMWLFRDKFPSYAMWKTTVINRIRKVQEIAWIDFCSDHPDMQVALFSLKILLQLPLAKY